MTESLIKGLLAVNCKYNFEVEDDGKCRSMSCMLNNDKEVSFKIQEHGCTIYKRVEQGKPL